MIAFQSRELIDEYNRITSNLPEFGRTVESPYLLTYADVVEAHFCIADFFSEEGYGLGGIGPRSVDLLVSAVERQWTGYQGHTVYETEYERIASLMYGIIKNHPFHDANKRTAFLCTLLQLHRLGRAICVPQREFEDLMVEVADNSIMRKSALRDLTKKRLSHPELRYLGRYLEKSSRKTAKLRKTIKFRELRQIVESNGFKFSNAHKGTIDIMKVERRVIHRFWRKDRIEDVQTKVGQVAYHGEGVDVPDNTLREVRRVCGLTEQDGYDGDVLLRDAQPTFQLIKSYRTSLQNLAYR